jgi:multiple sugar transport system ATP-binding protein
MASVEYISVRKSFDGKPVIRDFSFSVKEGALVVLLGPSGCGKSTLLRLTAGLEPVDSGEIRIGGQAVNTLDPRERNVAMVFQNYALYPHMTVFENIAFPLKMKGVGRSGREEKAKETARLLGIEDLLDKKPKALSGGQQQRVSMGRALVRDPSLFLMDEPLSNLDARLRVRLRAEIADLQRRTGTTMIYVTHDQAEALTLGEQVVVVSEGVIQQADDPAGIYEWPVNTFVAGFVGSPSMNLLPARLTFDGEGEKGAIVEVEGGIRLTVSRERVSAFDGIAERGKEKITLGLRPEAFGPVEAHPRSGRLPVVVKSIEMLGHETVLYGEIKGEGAKKPVPVAARVPANFHPAAGERVDLGVDMEKAYFFDPKTGKRL